LRELLRQVAKTDPQLAADLDREVRALESRRAFGLNFERHLPEAVELPGRPVRRGDKVRFLPARGDSPSSVDRELWYVAGLTQAGRVASLVRPAVSGEEPQTAERLVDDLVVLAEFRDPIYPGLVSNGRVERGGDRPFHTVINAENFHALEALLFTHEGKFDAIYIDPPYNTGNDGWIYNDNYVAGDDAYKHSKWLAFLERRLVLARRLLKPTGVIIVAIGDEEHHRLRMLMDQVFGVENFAGNITWRGGRKNYGHLMAETTDYMLVYSKDLSLLLGDGRKWREPKDGVDRIRAAAQAAWKESGGRGAVATAAFRDWWRALAKDDPAVQSKHYNRVDDVRPGEPYFGSDLSNPDPTWINRFDLLHPTTGEPVPQHRNGWRYTESNMTRLVGEGRIAFGKDHTTTATFKRYLAESADQAPENVFYMDRRRAPGHLAKVLGDKRFPFPKDHEVLMRWLRLVAPSDAVILDFFGGSGTTTEAVMRLNAEDGGTRQSILVTNNEVSAADAKALRKAGFRHGDPEWEARGVYEYVARPRIETVATGTRPDGSTYSDGLDQNAEFLTLTYEEPRAVRHGRAFERIAPLLWLKAGARGSRIGEPADDFAVADTYAVLFDLDFTRPFVEAVAKSDDVRMAFIVTEDERGYQTVCAELPAHVEKVRLYDAYLTNATLNAARD